MVGSLPPCTSRRPNSSTQQHPRRSPRVTSAGSGSGGGCGTWSCACAATTRLLSPSRVLSFMDSFTSCCDEEHVIFFHHVRRQGRRVVVAEVMRWAGWTPTQPVHALLFGGIQGLDQQLPGFKDHKLYPLVEESFHGTATWRKSGKVSEVMLANRTSASSVNG